MIHFFISIIFLRGVSVFMSVFVCECVFSNGRFGFYWLCYSEKFDIFRSFCSVRRSLLCNLHRAHANECDKKCAAREVISGPPAPAPDSNNFLGFFTPRKQLEKYMAGVHAAYQRDSSPMTWHICEEPPRSLECFIFSSRGGLASRKKRLTAPAPSARARTLPVSVWRKTPRVWLIRREHKGFS